MKCFLLFCLLAAGHVQSWQNSCVKWVFVEPGRGHVLLQHSLPCFSLHSAPLLYLQLIFALMEVLIRPPPSGRPLNGLSLLLAVWITPVMAALKDVLRSPSSPPPLPPLPLLFFSVSKVQPFLPLSLCKREPGSWPFLPIKGIWL